MNDVLGFAFKGNISASTLELLPIQNKFYLLSNNKELKRFVSELIKISPNYILGLGMYSGRDNDKLRIETVCKDSTKKIEINSFLNPSDDSKLAQRIGNSYCNYVSVEIMKAIGKGQLTSRYTFIHIPKSFPVNKASDEINKMLAKYI